MDGTESRSATSAWLALRLSFNSAVDTLNAHRQPALGVYQASWLRGGLTRPPWLIRQSADAPK